MDFNRACSPSRGAPPNRFNRVCSLIEGAPPNIIQPHSWPLSSRRGPFQNFETLEDFSLYLLLLFTKFMKVEYYFSQNWKVKIKI
jgi:hypothetical protein